MLGKNLIICVSTGAAYFLFCKLNGFLFASLGYSSGVDWIFLPSGFRLLFILVFVGSGAFGVAIASIILAFTSSSEAALVESVVIGAISGFSPLLARRICIDLLKLDVDLHNLNAATLLKAAVVFAAFSAVLHQFWYTWIDQTTNFLSSSAVMFIGDFVGTVVVLYFAKSVVLMFDRHRI